MLIAAPQSGTTYVVEVSGWDKNEDFFVEKADLHWSQESGKHVLLSRPVASGAILFLRLIDPMSLDRVHPVPYKAERMGTNDAGFHQVRLVAAHPRSQVC